jgi:hypothetical protein
VGSGIARMWLLVVVLAKHAVAYQPDEHASIAILLTELAGNASISTTAPATLIPLR